MKLKTVLSLLVLMSVSTSLGYALPFAVGDVFASTGNGTVKVFDQTGVLKQTLDNGLATFYTTGGVFDTAGNFYVTTFGNNVISKWDKNGNLINGSFMTGCNANCESMTRDRSGNVYVGQADGSTDIYKYDLATGARTATYNPITVPRGTDWIDLAADQKTIYYTSEGGVIRRFDVSANTQLADFNTNVGGTMYALRILSDGGVLVAHTNDVLRFDASGNVVQTYSFAHSGTLFALNLDPDGTSFWTGDLGGDNKVFHIDIASGAVLNSFATNPLNGQLAGLAIYGEITEGGGTVPEPGTVLMLGSVVGAIGLVYRKRLAAKS